MGIKGDDFTAGLLALTTAVKEAVKRREYIKMLEEDKQAKEKMREFQERQLEYQQKNRIFDQAIKEGHQDIQWEKIAAAKEKAEREYGLRAAAAEEKETEKQKKERLDILRAETSSLTSELNSINTFIKGLTAEMSRTWDTSRKAVLADMIREEEERQSMLRIELDKRRTGNTGGGATGPGDGAAPGDNTMKPQYAVVPDFGIRSSTSLKAARDALDAGNYELFLRIVANSSGKNSEGYKLAEKYIGR